MATDEEIIQKWKSIAGEKEKAMAIIGFYRAAEDAGKLSGRQAAVSAMENELLSDATLESAIAAFGHGRHDKRSTITMRAVMREALRIAKEKVENKI